MVIPLAGAAEPGIDEGPDLDFLEYLGEWQDRDGDLLDFTMFDAEPAEGRERVGGVTGDEND
jgi:hypothetical protein